MEEETHIQINYDTECPICFDNIYNNSGYINLECCKKSVHLNCLITWYCSSVTNLCFLCKQENNFCKELVSENGLTTTNVNNSHSNNNIELRENQTIRNPDENSSTNLTNIIVQPNTRTNVLQNIKRSFICACCCMSSIVFIVLVIELL